MKKKIICGFVCLVILFSLAGCASKAFMTTDKFKKVAKGHDLELEDILDRYAGFGHMKEATVAKSQDGWQIEFYVLDEASRAVTMFDYNKSELEGYKRDGALESYENYGDRSTYTLTSLGRYMYICRVGNTFLYVSEVEAYKDDINAILKELGYITGD